MRIPRWLVLLAVQLFSAAVLFVGIGLVAIGVSGALAAGLGATAGTSFVAGDAPGVHYSAARCADFHEYAPGARTCEAAATEHHFTEVVAYRAIAGMLGAAILTGYVVVRRQRARRAPPAPSVLPRAFVPTVGAIVFGGAAAVLAGQSVDLAVIGAGRGAGQFAAGAVVAAPIAAWYLLLLVRDLVDGARSTSLQPA
jgi:hypothetical protein